MTKARQAPATRLVLTVYQVSGENELTGIESDAVRVIGTNLYVHHASAPDATTVMDVELVHMITLDRVNV